MDVRVPGDKEGAAVSLKDIVGLTVLQLGLDPRKTWKSIRGLPLYFRDLAKYRSMRGPVAAFLPVLGDRYEAAGVLPRHYFHQDLWAARKIYSANPSRHV